MSKSMIEVARVVAGAGLIGLGALYLGQRALIYPRPREIFDPRDTPDAQLLRINEEAVCAWFPPKENGKVFLYFHGNADQIGGAGVFLGTEMFERGMGFLAVEYPGYALAKGSPNEKSILHTAELALNYLKEELGVSSDRIILFGQSLGTGVAVQLATNTNNCINQLILLSPFTSIPAVAHAAFPFLPRSFLNFAIHDSFDSLSFVQNYNQHRQNELLHCLILHGTEDSIVPFRQGQELASAFDSPSAMKNTARSFHLEASPALKKRTTFIPLRGIGHNDVFFDFYAHNGDLRPSSVVDMIARFASSSSSSSSFSE